MVVLFGTHPRYLDHDTGAGHPEGPDRLAAVAQGMVQAGVEDALVGFAPRPATRAELETTHTVSHLDELERFCSRGGGPIDLDTWAGAHSWEAAILAAGAGPDAVERLDRGEAGAAFLAVRPPGHHATGPRSMGFCLLNNVAVAAAHLAARGERVAIVDYDAHHGNGTQDIFYEDARVLYVSMHQFPWYPGSGRLGDTGRGPGRRRTLNLPFPAGATGDVYRAALDEVVAPVMEEFGPTWMIISAGFDAHRSDPLTDMGLSAGDFADLTRIIIDWVPPGRRLVFLEGGYDLSALMASSGACVSALAGACWRPEAPTSGGPGRLVVAEAAKLWSADQGV
ncbi:MAG: histone deacetylase family protein [Acidimicrobiales bacterium]